MMPQIDIFMICQTKFSLSKSFFFSPNNVIFKSYPLKAVYNSGRPIMFTGMDVFEMSRDDVLRGKDKLRH